MKRVLIAFLLLLPVSALAEEARDLADNPAIERRMINLAEKVRCLVCQSENVASSRSDWSNDVRQIMREKMIAGASDQEIMDLLVERFGKSVLFDPPVDRETMPLWAAPFVLLVFGIGILVFQLRKRRAAVAEPSLTPEAAHKAATLLEEESKS